MKKPTPYSAPTLDELHTDTYCNFVNHIGDAFYGRCPAADNELQEFKDSVKEVLAHVEGVNDESSTILVVKHKDGTCTVSQSSADYTGHG